MLLTTCLDAQVSAKAVNHDLAGRPMLRQVAPRLKCE
jgi:hypothetical protein